MHPVLFFGVVAFALALIFSQTLHYLRERRRLLTGHPRTSPTYTPLGTLPPVDPSADPVVLLTNYERAVAATTQHLYIRVTSGTRDAALHSRDAVALQQRVRDHRNAVLSRLTTEQRSG